MQRFGLKTIDDTDETSIVRPFLTLLQTNYLDFHGAFRLLCTFIPSDISDEAKKDAFVDKMLRFTSRPEMIVQDSARKDWKDWLQKYAERVSREKEEWGEAKAMTNGVNGNGEAKSGNGWEERRMREMRGKNPRFVLRQWVLEEVIKKVEDDSNEGKKVLAKIMHVRNPFLTVTCCSILTTLYLVRCGTFRL